VRVRVRISPPVPVPGRLTAGRLPLKQRIEVRVLARQPGLFSSPGQSAPPVRERQPVRVGQEARCARTPTGREAGPRCQMLRVRIPPSALGPRSSAVERWLCKPTVAGSRPAGGSDGRWGNWQTRRALTAELSRFETWAASVMPVWWQWKHASLVRRRSGFDSPGRLLCGCSSDGKSATSPWWRSRVRGPLSARVRQGWSRRR
jgi:hypothetical protein